MAIVGNLKGDYNKSDTYKRVLRVLFSLLFPVFAALIYWQANLLSYITLSDYISQKGQQLSQGYAELLLPQIKSDNEQNVDLLLMSLAQQVEVVKVKLYDHKGILLAELPSKEALELIDSGTTAYTSAATDDHHVYISELIDQGRTRGYLKLSLNGGLIKHHFDVIQRIQQWQLTVFFVLSFLFGAWMARRWYKIQIKRKYKPKKATSTL